MGGKIILCNEDLDLFKCSIEEDLISKHEYIIMINIALREDVIDLTSYSKDLEEYIDASVNYYETEKPTNGEKHLQFYKNCKNKSLELLQNAEYVELDFSLEEIFEILNKNPILKTKKIILKDNINLNIENLDKIKMSLGNIDNIYFKLSNNDKIISFHECYDTYITLENTVEEIKKFNFSPLETIMYVYDIVRNRLYQEENEDEEIEESRDLTSVLLGDKIVCLGYARIFSELLKKLGIESKQCYLYGIINGKEDGHARNEIYIKDDKYNVDGVYYFDATWDRKKSEEDESYLSSYRYFAKTKSEMDKLDFGLIIDKDFPYFSMDIVYKLEKYFETKKYEDIPNDMIRSINHMSSIIKDRILLKKMELMPISPFYGRLDTEKTLDELEEIIEYFNRPLYAETLLEVLYNVRKNQYYSDPNKYPFDVNEFYKIVVLSNWQFEPSPEEKIIEMILGERKNKDQKENMIRYIQETSLSKNIGQIKLTRTLRNISNRNK